MPPVDQTETQSAETTKAAATPAPGEKGYKPQGKVATLVEKLVGNVVTRVKQDAKAVWKEVEELGEKEAAALAAKLAKAEGK